MRAGTESDAARWFAALAAAAGRALLSAGTPPGDDPSLPPLPDTLEIEGMPKLGTELRLACPQPGVLEALCLAWFRYSDLAGTPALNVDVSTLPLTRFIAGANAQLYTCGPEDVGESTSVVVEGCRWP